MYSITIDLGKHTSPMDGMRYIDFCFNFFWVVHGMVPSQFSIVSKLKVEGKVKLITSQHDEQVMMPK